MNGDEMADLHERPIEIHRWIHNIGELMDQMDGTMIPSCLRSLQLRPERAIDGGIAIFALHFEPNTTSRQKLVLLTWLRQSSVVPTFLVTMASRIDDSLIQLQ